jgi:hypothetical protein
MAKNIWVNLQILFQKQTNTNQTKTNFPNQRKFFFKKGKAVYLFNNLDFKL